MGEEVEVGLENRMRLKDPPHDVHDVHAARGIGVPRGILHVELVEQPGNILAPRLKACFALDNQTATAK